MSDKEESGQLNGISADELDGGVDIKHGGDNNNENAAQGKLGYQNTVTPTNGDDEKDDERNDIVNSIQDARYNAKDLTDFNEYPDGSNLAPYEEELNRESEQQDDFNSNAIGDVNDVDEQNVDANERTSQDTHKTFMSALGNDDGVRIIKEEGEDSEDKRSRSGDESESDTDDQDDDGGGDDSGTNLDDISKIAQDETQEVGETMYGKHETNTEDDSDSDLDKTVLENPNLLAADTTHSKADVDDDAAKSNDNKEENSDVKAGLVRGLSETSNFRLSGTGNEFALDGDVKIELPDMKPGHNDAENDGSEDMGYNYEDEDIWALPEFESEETPWSELSRKEKIKKVLWHYIGKTILLIGLMYIFICSLSFLGDAFKLLGGKAAGKTFTNVDILSNRLAGVIIGILATVLLQSSSTTTSIVVSMVGSGSLLTVRQAIPIIMGANIGTTITNTIVAIGQINNKEDFRRAFAGATVHDAFNWLNVLVMLLLEEIFGYLEALTGAIVKNFEPGETAGSEDDYLKVLTDPFTKLIIQIDKNIITRIATGNITDEGQSIIKHKCGDSKCKFMFENVSSPDGGGWSDAAIGVILLIIALFLLCACLILVVKILHSLLKGQIAKWIRKFINANLPGKLAYFTGYIALFIGAGITILVQSSSIFTSSLTPLVGMGVLSLDRMYPLTLGSNIGTTGTGIIAAFAQDPAQIKDALQIALCHLFFNVTGIIIFYPIPFMRLPIRMAKFLGIRAAQYRWFAILYIIVPFFILPALGLGLSLIHIALTITLLVIVAVIVFVIIVVKILQRKIPQKLPKKFRDWKWLPEWMRSLEPADRLIKRVLRRFGRLKMVVYCRRRCPCKCCAPGEESDV